LCSSSTTKIFILKLYYTLLAENWLKEVFRIDFDLIIPQNLLVTKYKEYFDKMVSENKGAFDDFTRAHFEYSIDQDKYQEKFNKEGEKINIIIHEYEDRLCKHSEGAGFGKYTSNLAEKFQDEVRSHFPLIDHVGIVLSKTSASAVNKFSLKKINL